MIWHKLQLGQSQAQAHQQFAGYGQSRLYLPLIVMSELPNSMGNYLARTTQAVQWRYGWRVGLPSDTARLTRADKRLCGLQALRIGDQHR